MRQITRLLAIASALLLGACAATHRSPAPTAAAVSASSACPQGIPAGTRCYSGQDSAGAFFWVAIPADWNRVLVMHAHGGPELGARQGGRAPPRTCSAGR